MVPHYTRREGKGTCIFRLIVSCLCQAVQERRRKSSRVWMNCSCRKKQVLQAGGRSFMGLSLSWKTLLRAYCSRCHGCKGFQLLFVASQGQREKGYVNILFGHRQTRATCPFSQNRPSQIWFYWRRCDHNTGISTLLTHSGLSFL